MRATDWYINEFNRRRSGGEGDGKGSTFWDPPTRILLGHFPEIIIIYLESSARELSIGTLFEQIGLRGGAVDMSKSQRHTCSGAGRGASQADEAANYLKLIFSGILKKWKQCGTASQLWVPRSRVHGRLYLSFCPIILQHFSFRSW